MSELVDTDVQRRVATLVEKLTDKRKFALDPELAKDVKRLCKASDANVRAAFDAITEQLKTNHAQVPLPTFLPTQDPTSEHTCHPHLRYNTRATAPQLEHGHHVWRGVVVLAHAAISIRTRAVRRM